MEIEAALKKRQVEGNLRVLKPVTQRMEARITVNGKTYVDFSSNDYLGLSSHPKLQAAALKAIEEQGTSSCASRLLSGDLDIFHRLEEKTAAFKKKEAVLVFNSGYQANLGIISALYGKDACIFSDRLNHASILDGIKLSGAKLFRFQHNDLEHLESLLKQERNNSKKALIVTESVFSMDGDKAPLKGIAALKERYGCELFVDEAHATGIFGKNGSGLAEEAEVTERIDFIMGTFSKALGSFGAYFAGSKKTIDYLVNTCRSFIYSTALPPAVIAANLAAIGLISEEPQRRKKVLASADYFRGKLSASGFEVRGESQIVPMVLGDSIQAVRLAEKIQAGGYWAMPIRPPTVPKNQARLRFSVCFNHEIEMLDQLVNIINKNA